MTARAFGGEAGFSLVETLMAFAIILAIASLASGLAVDAQALWRAESGRVDLQQRARVTADLLTRALRDAGGGPVTGSARGPLLRVMPPIVPRRLGRRHADPPAVVRADAVSVISASPDGEGAMLLLDAPAGATYLELAPSSACDLPACGFTPGASALLVNGQGSYDVFTVLHLTGPVLTVRHHGPGSATSYPAGAPVVMADVAVYYYDGATRTLRRSDGDASDMPLIDDVVEMRVEYYGESAPPVWPRPPLGSSNCLYAADGAYHAALLPHFPPAGGSQTALHPGQLTDGPWCGGGSSAFDADLLRIRRVRLSVRLQAADPAVRGRDAAWFRLPGSASRSHLLVPDVTVVVDVAPPNLRTGW